MVHPWPVVAFIGDIIRSRKLSEHQRGPVQRDLEQFLVYVNRRYRRSVLAQFLVTLGDEFQGLVRDPVVVPEIVQDARERLPEVRFRMAVGYGKLTTPLKKVALGTDGPAWYNARDLLNSWRAGKREGVGFHGFPDHDVALNGLSGLLTHHWNGLEASQRKIITALRHHEGLRKDAAADLGISPQSMSNRAQSAGAREYEDGMIAMRDLLRRYTPPEA